MCGRFTRSIDTASVAEAFGVEEISSDLDASYNIAPTQSVAVIVSDGKKRLIEVRWGLVPLWAKDPPYNPTLLQTSSHSPRQAQPLHSRRRCPLAKHR